MIKALLVLFFTSITPFCNAQNFTGQWKGEFTDKSSSFVGWGGDRCEYVLELECAGTDVNGYSYTYFSSGGQRYYTICKLIGKINPASHSIEVTEIERTKTNVPTTINNCFQTHRLTYFKKGNVQTLEGSWVPAPNQTGDCGFGSSSLSRRVLEKNASVFNNVTARIQKPVKKTTPIPNKTITPTSPIVKNKITPSTKQVAPVIAKSKNIPPAKKVEPTIAKVDPVVKEKIQIKSDPIITKSTPVEKIIPNSNFEKRGSTLLKTIELSNATFRVDLYDNGAIDGDSVSLFFNGKLVLAHKRLGDKPITLTLNIDDKVETNELIMYADNLGAIAPNTALMVVTDGDSRYEARISSDLQKSGTIRFVHKNKNEQ